MPRTLSITGQSLAAELCRSILADRPNMPLRFKDPGQISPPRYEKTPACPAPRGDSWSHPTGPCVQFEAIPRGVQVSVFMGGEWAEQQPGWTLPYPAWFEQSKHCPPGTSLGPEFWAAAAALVDKLLVPVAAMAAREKVARGVATTLLQRAIRDEARLICGDSIDEYLDQLVATGKIPGGDYEAMRSLADSVNDALRAAADNDTITVAIKEG